MDYSLLLYFCRRVEFEDESTPIRTSMKAISLKKNDEGEFIYELGMEKSPSISAQPLTEQDIRPSSVLTNMIAEKVHDRSIKDQEILP